MSVVRYLDMTDIDFLFLFRLQICFWNHEILTPIQKFGMMGPGRDAFKKLKILLDRVMLRRTKANTMLKDFHIRLLIFSYSLNERMI